MGRLLVVWITVVMLALQPLLSAANADMPCDHAASDQSGLLMHHNISDSAMSMHDVPSPDSPGMPHDMPCCDDSEAMSCASGCSGDCHATVFNWALTIDNTGDVDILRRRVALPANMLAPPSASQRPPLRPPILS